MKFIFFILGLLATNIVGAETDDYPNTTDARVQNIINASDNAKDLEALTKLEISNFSMKDFHSRGKTIHKNLTAQQLEKILPNLVTTSKAIIPSVYSIAKSVSAVGKQTFIVTKSPHGFLNGDTIKLIIKNQGDQQFKVSKVIDDKQFAVDAIINHKIFVYGKEVRDFRNINYPALNALHISATQALQKTVLLLITKNHELTTINKELSERLDDIEKLLAKDASATTIRQ